MAVPRHVDIYHRHWYTGEYIFIGMVEAEIYPRIAKAFVPHTVSEPHFEGQCKDHEPPTEGPLP